jgi:hypothetical protein
MLATLLLLATTAAPIDFTAAKARADADEATLPTIGKQALVKSQGGVLERAADACRTNEPPKSFTVVLELDAAGKPVNHWRDSDTQLAQCMEEKLSRNVFYVPVKAPFYTSFEVTFTP